MEVQANAGYKRPEFKPGMLVSMENYIGEEVGIVTQVSRHYVHVTWLAAKEHFNGFYSRHKLEVCPLGTRVVVKQR